MGLVVLVSCITLQRIAELQVAAANRKWALAAGAQEYGKRHYCLFFLLHIGWMISWMIESYSRQEMNAIWLVWLGAFCVAQILRYWCIHSLGRHWNTRILVIPGVKMIRSGPYRYFPHPNYAAVAIEMLSVPLMFNAWITALLFSLLNALLLIKIRIPAEEEALQQHMG